MSPGRMTSLRAIAPTRTPYCSNLPAHFGRDRFVDLGLLREHLVQGPPAEPLPHRHLQGAVQVSLDALHALVRRGGQEKC
jgi:hypothetical protein